MTLIDCPSISRSWSSFCCPGAGIQASGHFLALIDCPSISCSWSSFCCVVRPPLWSVRPCACPCAPLVWCSVAVRGCSVAVRARRAGLIDCMRVPQDKCALRKGPCALRKDYEGMVGRLGGHRRAWAPQDRFCLRASFAPHGRATYASNASQVFTNGSKSACFLRICKRARQTIPGILRGLWRRILASV